MVAHKSCRFVILCNPRGHPGAAEIAGTNITNSMAFGQDTREYMHYIYHQLFSDSEKNEKGNMTS